MIEQPQGQGLGAAMQQNAQPVPEEQGNVPPEEQAEYDQFVNNAYELIASEGTVQPLLKAMESGQQGLATAAVRVVSRVEDSARKNGLTPTDDVLFAAGVEVIEALAHLSKEANVKDFSEQEIEGALYQALDQYREENPSKIDQQANQQALQEMTQADQAGQLSQLLPGLSQ